MLPQDNTSNTIYYISTGEQTKMYTLRVRYPEKVFTPEGSFTITRDYYVRNLSIDKEKAEVKAKDIVSRLDGKFVDSTLESLEEIRRRTSEEVEAARLASEKEAQERFEERERQRREDAFDKISRKVWPFGQCHTEAFENAPDSYILYFLSLDSEDDVILQSLQEALKNVFPHLIKLPEPNGEYYGEVKKREDFNVTPIARFSFDGFYGTVYIEKFVKDTGELIVYKGSAPTGLDLGLPATFKATIKSHEEYKDENQTFVQRIAKAETL